MIAVEQPDIEALLSKADPALGRVIEAVCAKIGRQRIMPSRASPFGALTRAIVYQSVSGNAAAAIFARLKIVAGTLTPGRVTTLTPAAIMSAGLSKSKTQAIRSLASRMVLCEPSNSKSAPDAIRRGGDRGADRYSRHCRVDSQCVSDFQPGATRCHAGQRSRHSPRGAIGLRAERCRDGATSPRQGPSVAALPQHRVHLSVERRQNKSLRSRSHIDSGAIEIWKCLALPPMARRP